MAINRKVFYLLNFVSKDIEWIYKYRFKKWRMKKDEVHGNDKAFIENQTVVVYKWGANVSELPCIFLIIKYIQYCLENYFNDHHF